MVGLTANGEVNSLFAREAIHEYGVPEAFVALTPDRRVPEAMLERQGSATLFDGRKDVEGWNVRFRHGRARVALFAYEARPELVPLAESEDRLVLLVRKRSGSWVIEHRGRVARAGDETWAALDLDAEEAALETLARAGWTERKAG